MRVAAFVLSVLAVDGARRAPDCFSKYDGKALVRLQPCTEADVKGMSEFVEEPACALLSEGEFELPAAGGCADLLAVCNSEMAAIVEGEFRDSAEIVAPDAGNYYRKLSGGVQPFMQAFGTELSSAFYSDWRDLDARMGRVEAAVAGSGGLATIETAGVSLQGRPIKLVRFTGKGYSPGMKKVVVTYNMHAREWVAGMTGVYAVEKLVEKVKADGNYLAGMEVVLVPMANPDGFVHTVNRDRFHRKNMRDTGSWFCEGVDLNRNFDAHWNQGGASTSKCSDTYLGPKAMSEPETLVYAKIMKESKMTVYLDVHAYGQWVLSAYGWTTAQHPRHKEYRALGAAMKGALESRYGKTYVEGPIATTLYRASGSSVDYADDLGALGICWEVRPSGNQGAGGFAPPTSEILPACEEAFDGLLASIDYARSN